jgi:transcriptional regulator with PAS, ATPase and Fis domain
MALNPQDEFLTYVFPGESAPALEFRQEIEQLNRYCQRYKGAINCVLLTGESGVGKNYTAQAISAHSQWLTLTDEERQALLREGSFLLPATALIDHLLLKQHRSSSRGQTRTVRRLTTILGPQLVDDLAASELFGHKRGAFTGADRDHAGIFGDDAVDDVLLDEIGDLSPSVQAKLLQFIETRTFRPTGGLSEDEKVSEHRLFLATNRNLEERVQKEQFREDLFWRIQGYRVHVPPLRERRDVMRDIAYSVLRSVNQRQRGSEQIVPSLDPQPNPFRILPGEEGKGKGALTSTWVMRLDEMDLQWCESYLWPGNVRELRQRMDRYVYNDGKRRLRDVMPPPTLRTTTALLSNSTDTDTLVESAVWQYLDAVLEGKQAAPGQPGMLLSRFERSVKNAVYRFKSNRRLTSGQLSTLFPEARDAGTTIGRWRPGSAE